MLTLGIVFASVSAVTLVWLLVRTASGSPSGFERGVYGVLAPTLFLAGVGVIGFHYYRAWNSDRSSEAVAEKKSEDSFVFSSGDLDLSNPTVRDGLTRIHRQSVGNFVAQADFGMRRMPSMPSVSMDVVTHPTSGSGGSGEQPKAPPNNQALIAALGAHFYSGRPFPVAAADNKEHWNTTSSQLVGLVVHPDPVVYTTSNVPGMKGVKETPSRSLDKFETAGLAAIRKGENFAVHVEGDKIRMVAPIFAAAQCTSCHAKQGEMLGAFSYTIHRQKVNVPVGPPATPMLP